jgi:16S rRNA (adenine1518-N6/adenine1519-N6)-dimethyltransferase
MRMVATLQLEVAQRLMAKPGSPDYGVLTLLLQLDYEPDGWFRIPAACFFPAPEVDSACINLRRRPRPLVTEAERPVFVRLVKLGFSQRRKMMLKLLKQEWPADQLERAFAELHIPPQTRAEALGLQQFIGLARRLAAAA